MFICLDIIEISHLIKLAESKEVLLGLYQMCHLLNIISEINANKIYIIITTKSTSIYNDLRQS